VHCSTEVHRLTARHSSTDLLTADYVVFEVDLDEDMDLLRLPDDAVPTDWQHWPWPASTQRIGTFWHERRDSVALSVPSAVVPVHRNVLLNIQHPRFADLMVEGPTPFPVDTHLASSAAQA